MKKIFKALAISVASLAMVAGIATATACSGGYNGTYTGSYHYTNGHGATYGMVVEVTVENNIITKVKDITNTEATKGIQNNETWTVVSPAGNWGWGKDENENWVNNASWLLQQYEGKSAAEILDIKVFYDSGFVKEGEAWVRDPSLPGEPYKVDKNVQLNESGLLISGATQGSGRLLLAVQDALLSK